MEEASDRCVLVEMLPDPMKLLGFDLSRYTLIGLDAQFSSMDGMQAIQLLKDRDASQKLQFVVFDSLPNDLHRFQCYEAGAAIYTQKPSNPAELQKSTQECLDLLYPSHYLPPQDTGFYALSDWIDLKCDEGTPVSINVLEEGKQGLISIYDGNIWDAKWDTVRGEEALFAILSLDKCNFNTEVLEKTFERTIQKSWQDLLVEFHQNRKPPMPETEGEEGSSIVDILLASASDPFENLMSDAEVELIPAEKKDHAPEASIVKEPEPMTDATSQSPEFWELKLSNNHILQKKPKEVEPDTQLSYLLLSDLGDLAMKLEVPMFHRATFYGPKVTQEIVYDGQSLVHGVFPPELDRDQRKEFLGK